MIGHHGLALIGHQANVPPFFHIDNHQYIVDFAMATAIEQESNPPMQAKAATHREHDCTSAQRFTAEALGTLFITCAVIGSGIAAARMHGSPGLELLENTIATAGALFAVIAGLHRISGAHFNPIVTMVDLIERRIEPLVALGYIAAQVVGACAGAILANLMYGYKWVNLSTHARSTGTHLLAEVVATAGLIIVIFTVAQVSGYGAPVIAVSVASYITAAYWFTSSTSFANPAVALGRCLSNSFAGISPGSFPAFAGAEILGGLAGLAVLKTLRPHRTPNGERGNP